MKGKISLKKFITQVKNELIDAMDEKTPIFELKETELEVSFALDVKAKAGAKLFVVDMGGETKAAQTHKVKLTFKPLQNKGTGTYYKPVYK